jgi:hypothetical protein
MTYCRYYCFHCDRPADEHRAGSCRNCGRAVTNLVEEAKDQVAIVSVVSEKRSK